MELVVVRPKMNAPIVTMTTPKTTSPCQLEHRGSKTTVSENCPGEVGGVSKVEQRLTLQSGCRFLRAWLGWGTDLSGSQTLKKTLVWSWGSLQNLENVHRAGWRCYLGTRRWSRLPVPRSWRWPGRCLGWRAPGPAWRQTTPASAGCASSSHGGHTPPPARLGSAATVLRSRPWTIQKIRFADWNDQRWRYVSNLDQVLIWWQFCY